MKKKPPDGMSVPEFLAGFAMTGRIEGVGLDSTPDEWERQLGSDFVDDHDRKQFRRDYGLVELGFWREEGNWTCGLISVQVHRLWHDRETIGPAGLREKHGDFPKAVRFVELRDELGRSGNELVLVEDEVPNGYRRYYVPPGKAVMLVDAAPGPRDPEDPPYGSLWSLSAAPLPWINPMKVHKK
ncbi:hypothetical protein ORV05_03325 [Amycolatopsis cynarae]|uniref:Uncharacterized protein n=1 Tax=Amycolatopsis cynarae TaxID=2995223 RepID=A0ABY7B6P1_9PSEU|nr:hypothetical protein [Amycolatopsis sp. HUAS 11-8]WAL66853.1 hypothetical protein ORV05_03325 [Amycolatopsis sp. HUAS 11-8]